MSFEEKLVKVYKKEYSKLVNIARKRLANNHSVAEEAVQETFEKACRYKDTYDETKKMSPWIRSIFNNTVKNFSNSERLYGAIDERVEAEPPVRSDIADIKKLLYHYKGSSLQKRVIALRYLHGVDVKDIPSFVPVTYGTCRVILSNFKKEMMVV